MFHKIFACEICQVKLHVVFVFLSYLAAISKCPGGKSVPESCPDDLCLKATCESHPEAKCFISRCGGCFAKFFDANDTVIEDCSQKVGSKFLLKQSQN